MDRAEPVSHGARAMRTVQTDEEREMEMPVNLLVKIHSYSKDQVLDVLQFQLSSKDALEKMREIRNVGLEDELGHY